jgi:adenosine deaminase CECR1
MEAHIQKRKQLIAKDRSLRVDARVSFGDDDIRKRAEEIVRRVEDAEKTKIWDQDHEGIMHVFPGMEFLTGEHINQII